MTVAEQPEDPEEPPVIPSKLEGKYKLSAVENAGKFSGYELTVEMTELKSDLVESDKFADTEEIIEFGKALQDAGATLELEETSATKYTAKGAVKNKLIFDVRYGKTTIEGEFEVSESTVKIKQREFTIQGKQGVFATAEDIFEFIEICLEDLRYFDEPKRLWSRKNYALQSKEDYSERGLERNRKFWADPEKYLPKCRSKYFKKW